MVFSLLFNPIFFHMISKRQLRINPFSEPKFVWDVIDLMIGIGLEKRTVILSATGYLHGGCLSFFDVKSGMALFEIGSIELSKRPL